MNRIITVLSGAFLVLLAGCDDIDDGSMDSEAEQFAASEAEDMLTDAEDDSDDEDDDLPGQPSVSRIRPAATTASTATATDILGDRPGSNPGDLAPAAFCGNGVVEPGEQCDDGNDFGVDGCDACVVHAGPKLGIAGEGQAAPTQLDDLGDRPGSNPGDLAPAAFCGNGVVEPGEQCDDGNDLTVDGCDDCVVHAGPKLDAGADAPAPTQAGPDELVAASFCGNGIVEYGEECDSDDGVGWCVDCKLQGRAVEDPEQIGPAPVCGNSIVEAGEQCDDGNGFDGDGCDACVREKSIGRLGAG